MSREDSYRLVQRNAMKTWEQGADFLTSLKADPEVASRIPAAELEAMFDLGYHFKHVETIFERVCSGNSGGFVMAGLARPSMPFHGIRAVVDARPRGGHDDKL